MLEKHPYYNTENFPNYILTDSNWSIWANGAGYCASIPTPKMQRRGCRASTFGTIWHVQMTIGTKLYPR